MSSDEEGTRSEEEGSVTKKVKLDEATLATIVDRVTNKLQKALGGGESSGAEKSGKEGGESSGLGKFFLLASLLLVPPFHSNGV